MNTAAVLDVVVKAQTSKASVELKKFEKTLKQTAKSAKDTDRNFEVANKKVTTFGSSISDTNQRAMLFKNTMGLIKFPAMIAGLGGMAQAAAAASAGVGGLASALAPLSGLLAAYPALIGAFGQAMGVKAVAGLSDVTDAVGGLNEKLDETSDEFKALSPQAQEFARSLQTAKAPLLDIQKTVQRPLFEGLNEGLQAAQKNLPALEEVMQGTAGAMGRLAAEAGRFVGREGFGRDFQEVGGNNAQLLVRLGEAGMHFADALRHVVVVSQPLIDFLGRGAVKLGEWIEAESKAGRESGRMAEFFERTEKVVRQLVSIGSSLASVFLDIGAAARPLGEEIMAELVKQAEALSDWTGSHGGELRKYFEDAKQPLWEAGRLVGDLVKGFFELSNTPGLTGFIEQFRKQLLPALINMTRMTTKQFGPALINTLTQGAKLMTNFLGSSGPLTMFVESLGQGFRFLNKLIDAVPGLGHVLAAALGGLSIVKLLGLKSAVMFVAGKGAGTALGKGLIAGWLIALPMIAIELHDWVRKRREAIINAGIDIGEWLVNGIIDTVNVGIRAINEVFDKLNVLGKFGVEAPELGEIGRVDWGPFRENMEEGERIVAATVKGMRQKFGDVPKAVGENGKEARNVLRDFLGQMRHGAEQDTKGIERSTDQNLGKAANDAGKHGKDLQRGFGGSVTGLSKTTRNAMENIGENVNEAGRALGVQKKVKFSFKDMAESEAVGGAGRMRGGPIELALGGLAALVPGRSTGDRHTLSIDGVPKAKVESGEGVFVGNRKMMGAAAAANAAVPRFQAGGMVDPAGPGTGVVNKAIADVVGRWSTQYNAAINYGYDPGGGHDSPGHNVTGTATDTSPAGGWVGSSLTLFEKGLRAIVGQVDQILYGTAGIGTPYPNHGRGNHAHIEWGMHPEVQGAVMEQIKRIILQGPEGPLKDIGQKAVDRVRSAANKWLGKQMGGIGGGDLGAFGAEGQYSKSMLADLWTAANGGLADPNTAAAVALAESGGDPKAFGPPDGRGLWQIEWGMHPEVHKYGSPYDPGANARMAGDIYRAAGGWSPWVAFTNGNYQQFLAEGGGLSIPELFPQLGSADQDTRKDTQARILEKIGKFGLHPDTLTRLFQGTNALAEHQEYASLAASGDITDANDNLIPGLFRSGTEHSWLLKARDEAWTLRENLIKADTAMKPQIEAFETKDGLIKKAEKRLKQVRDALHEAQVKLKGFLEDIEHQRKIIEAAREKLALTGNKELSNSEKKKQQDKIDAAQKVIENITGEKIPRVESDIDRATRERDALVEPVIPALAAKFEELRAIKEGIRGDSYSDELTGMGFDGLKTIQGTGSSMDLFPMPDDLHQRFGGTLNDIQQQLLAMIPEAKPGDTVIDQLEAALALSGLTADLSDDIAAQSQIVTYWEEELARLQSSGGSAQDIGSAANSLQSARDALAGLQETTSGSDTDSLKLEALMAENARLRMSAQQAGTFAGFFKQFSAMPQFATGGVMSQTGPALVHGREGIFTPDQMAALGGRGDVNVNVNLDGMDVVVETWIDGVLAKETRKALSRGPTVGRRTS